MAEYALGVNYRKRTRKTIRKNYSNRIKQLKNSSHNNKTV